MAITIHITYTGEGDHARRFAREMTETGVVDAIRAEDGNERYAYYFPMEDEASVLLIDSWRDQASIDRHHASPMMQTIIALREKYDLRMRVERFVSDESGVPEHDRQFIRT